MEARIGAKLIATLKPGNKPFEICDADLPGFVLRVQPSGVMTFYASYRLKDGRRNRTLIGKLGPLTALQARDRAKEILADIVRGVDPQAAKKKARSQNFQRFIAEIYRPWAENKGNLKTGVENIKRLESCFATVLDKPLWEITNWSVERWRSTELKNGKKPQTINRDVAVLRGVLSKAVEWKILDVHPLHGLKPLKTDNLSRVRYLSFDETSRLKVALAKRDGRLRAARKSGNEWRNVRGYPLFEDFGESFVDFLEPMTLVSLHTGLRRGELFQLRWEQVDLKGRCSQILVLGATAKSKQSRRVPLNLEIVEVLKRWHIQSGQQDLGLVFPGRQGKQLTDLKKSWATVLGDAKISDFRWHDLRHTFASNLVMAGIDLNTVRELLGHKDIVTTMRYAHLSGDKKAEAVQKLVGI